MGVKHFVMDFFTGASAGGSQGSNEGSKQSKGSCNSESKCCGEVCSSCQGGNLSLEQVEAGLAKARTRQHPNMTQSTS